MIKQLAFFVSISFLMISCLKNPFDDRSIENTIKLDVSHFSQVNIDSVELYIVPPQKNSVHYCDDSKKICELKFTLDQAQNIYLAIDVFSGVEIIARQTSYLAAGATTLQDVQRTVNSESLAWAFRKQYACDPSEDHCFLDERNNLSYRTFSVGNQTWMAENLNFELEDRTTSVCYDEQDANCVLYGRLYTWEGAMDHSTEEGSSGVCPIGWHLPSDAEWKELEISLGMSSQEADSSGFRGTDQGAQLRDANRFADPYALSADSVKYYTKGFSAIGAGFREVLKVEPFYDSFDRLGSDASFWTSTESPAQSGFPMAIKRKVGMENEQVFRNFSWASNFFSVRCVKD